MFNLHDLLSTYGPSPLPRSRGEAVVFSGVAIDSRQAQPGNLFVALPGERQDGHAFITDALAKGCPGALARAGCVPADVRQALSAAVFEWDGQQWRQEGPAQAAAVLVLVPEPLDTLQRLAGSFRARFSPTVVGITGSVGKSSTKEMIAAILSLRLVTLKSERSLNNEIGLPLTLLELRPEHQAVVLEMGTYGVGEIALLARIARPQVGVVTNVSHSHLERMGSIETIARAKSELPAALPAAGLAVLNGDEPLVRAMAEVTAAPVLFYGQGEVCHLRAVDVRTHGIDGISFTVQADGATRNLRCGLPGRHSVYTALAGAAVSRHLGLSWDEVQAGLLDVRAHLRLVRIPGVGGSTLLDDSYNASPVSSRAALELLAELPGRKVAVLGDMLELGSFEAEGHRLVGQWAAGVVEELYVLGLRARLIGEAALAAGLAPDRVHFVADHPTVIQMLRERLAAGDVVLVKGSRAMGMDRIVAALRAGQEE
jgi:UDP-N-acetylmuramoyl-tripeptide--D-alanyl-D-alanine ligase